MKLSRIVLIGTTFVMAVGATFANKVHTKFAGFTIYTAKTGGVVCYTGSDTKVCHKFLANATYYTVTSGTRTKHNAGSRFTVYTAK